MKFKQLMLAPVALGMVAPVAANAADLNMAAVNQYTSSEQVSSITQLTDVRRLIRHSAILLSVMVALLVMKTELTLVVSP